MNASYIISRFTFFYPLALLGRNNLHIIFPLVILFFANDDALVVFLERILVIFQTLKQLFLISYLDGECIHAALVNHYDNDDDHEPHRARVVGHEAWVHMGQCCCYIVLG